MTASSVVFIVACQIWRVAWCFAYSQEVSRVAESIVGVFISFITVQELPTNAETITAANTTRRTLFKQKVIRGDTINHRIKQLTTVTFEQKSANPSSTIVSKNYFCCSGNEINKWKNNNQSFDLINTLKFIFLFLSVILVRFSARHAPKCI